MPPFSRRITLILLGICLAASTVWAQDPLRILPADAKRAKLGKPQPMPFVELNRKIRRLAPGAVISDRNNRLILQGNLPPGAPVAYTVDMEDGEITHIYILTLSEQKEFKPR